MTIRIVPTSAAIHALTLKPTTIGHPSLWVALGLLLAACGDGGGDGEDRTTGTAAGSSVTNPVTSVGSSDPTTGAGTSSDSGEPPSCGACGGDQVCIGGECTDVPAECPCPVETYCELVSNKCVVGCTRDEECDKGRICDSVARTCAAGCREDSGCGAGQICEGDQCVTGCRSDAACGPMEICDGTTCRAGCYTDKDCSQGTVCDGTVCRVGCTSEAECPAASEICDLDKKTCRAGCITSADCPLEKLCDLDAQVCTAGCDSNAKCGAGKICESGACVPGCANDAGCGGGAICQNNVCAGGLEAPYNACATNADCVGDAVCVNEELNFFEGSFCSPPCVNNQCPAPANGVKFVAAKCLFSINVNYPNHCAVVCDLGFAEKDNCGPSSECKDIFLPPELLYYPGICAH